MGEVMDGLDLRRGYFVATLVDNRFDLTEHIPDAYDQGILTKPLPHGSDAAVEVTDQFRLMEKFRAVLCKTTLHNGSQHFGAT